MVKQSLISDLATAAYERCDVLAQASDEPGRLTRLFCSPAMHEAHRLVAGWMAAAGMATRVDAAGNLRGIYFPPGCDSKRRVMIGSHLDTVVDAGRYDGALGVMLGIAVVEALHEAREALPWGLEVIGFSDEEGVRFKTPFLGSRALTGTLDDAALARRDASGVTVAEALREFGADPAGLPECALQPGEVVAYLEAHIEQGPRLESLESPLGVATAIAGQTRLTVEWTGKGGHAGTVPMDGRCDPLPAACRWTAAVEEAARETDELVATVGRLDVEPNATNCIPRRVRTSLDLRHEVDAVRLETVMRLTDLAEELGRESRVGVEVRYDHEHSATPMDKELTNRLAAVVEKASGSAPKLVSGAGHDAGVMAAVAPAALLFLRSPGGVSHDPAETVLEVDVAVALASMVTLVEELAARDVG